MRRTTRIRHSHLLSVLLPIVFAFESSSNTRYVAGLRAPDTDPLHQDHQRQLLFRFILLLFSPAWFLIRTLFYILRPLIIFVELMFKYIIIRPISFSFDAIARLYAVYIFFGMAAIIGIGFGLVSALIYRAISVWTSSPQEYEEVPYSIPILDDRPVQNSFEDRRRPPSAQTYRQSSCSVIHEDPDEEDNFSQPASESDYPNHGIGISVSGNTMLYKSGNPTKLAPENPKQRWQKMPL
ncbi:hypothetical protein NEOLI_004456 [Neolecta irregularis DAH-3]|uniref:Uncharacterized protein n=1 Tax=Neolecta irregularis (strain DAH-3) TaxID=1198029 RepID=A0A1U7LLF4_NEOID|nr:hypothetical protein NEOLI_004456 [Neolecta irregularis DAH-3]|eukprot:OLL23496.1 hypothetical protein NEOLI_004456 [Neolecta irregularis DAH-3]